MNRKQRRATSKQSTTASRRSAPGDLARQLFSEAARLRQQQRLDEAARAYKRLLALDPHHAQGHNDLACVLQAQGKTREASAHFARALALMPQLFDQSGEICATLVAIVPAIGEAMRRAAAAWPQALPLDQLLSGGIEEIAGDPLLLCILQSTPVRDFALERVLTLLRCSMLADIAAGKELSESGLVFCCALAKQCFINEYVFALTADEDAQVARLTPLDDYTPQQLAALAMYTPLHALPSAAALHKRAWPAVVDEVVTQQVREPAAERALRDAIPRLTAIDDGVSQRVREQYEQNPYPRWVNVAGNVEPVALEKYLRDVFPTVPFTPRSDRHSLEVLVAGCGTGWQAIGITQKFQGAQVLAADLSLSSLGYAVRKTPAALAKRIDYAQADILKLGSLDRRFDLIEASGVLHHMADPFEGWRILLSLLKPGGFMHIGLYSELARREVVAVRVFIVERGYGATAADIRRCRQELIASPLRGIARVNDFFTTSECRDLLFHAHEIRVGIPAIKKFITEHGLRFIGFEFDADSMRRYRALFAEQGWSISDLDRWHALETAYPDTFANMYQMWLQKS